MISNFKTCLVLPLLAIVMAGSSSLAQQVEGIAIVVNDEPITTFEVRNRMRLILYSYAAQPTEDVLQRVQEQALDSLVDEALQLQTARDFEVQITEQEVDASIQDLAARNGITYDAILSDLSNNGIDAETLRRQLRAEIAWQILVSGRYRSRIRISDAQIDTALDRVIENASQPQARLAEILIEVPVGINEEEVQQILGYIYQQLQQGAPFQQLAQQFSSAPSAGNGGDTGYQPISQLSPQIQQILPAMTPGAVANPLRVPGGYLILLLIDARDGTVVEQLRLYQISKPAAEMSDSETRRLNRALDDLDSCDDIEGQFADFDGVTVTDLSTVGANALLDSIRSALSGLEPVSATPFIQTAAGEQSFILCDRTMAGPGVPSQDDVEDQLTNQQLSLLARRWLRDIRRDATIEVR